MTQHRYYAVGVRVPLSWDRTSFGWDVCYTQPPLPTQDYRRPNKSPAQLALRRATLANELGRAAHASSGTSSNATMLMILISGLIAGPAVSLYGSPTVSPVTAAL